MKQIIIDIRSEHEDEIANELWGLIVDGGVCDTLIEYCTYDLNESTDNKNKRLIITEGE